MTTRLAVLGATGSIGRQALEIAHAHPDRLRVVALSADTNGIALAGLGVEHDVPRARLEGALLQAGKRRFARLTTG